MGHVERLTLDEVILKGTHNSYSCSRARPLCVNHPPQKQIDDFGVWSLEIDCGLEIRGGAPVAVVGHDRPGHGSCWAYFLGEYIQLVLQARSLEYRPVFVYVELKSWKRPRFRAWQRSADSPFSLQEKREVVLETFHRFAPGRVVDLEEWIVENGRWPYPLELAGHIVLYEPNKRSADGQLLGLRGTHAAHCVTPEFVESTIETGLPLEARGSTCPGGARALRLDQYQADWTFAYGVPPNPLVVDATASESTFVDDSEGRHWRCGSERSHGQRVGQHGTYRFPYRSVEQAMERARGVTPVTHGEPDSRRAGAGWSVLIRTGSSQAPMQSILTVDE